MSRYPDAREGFPKPRAQHEDRRYSAQETQAFKHLFSVGHPLQKLSLERQQVYYLGELKGREVDNAITLVDLIVQEGTKFLKTPAPAPAEGAEAVKPTKPLYTAATLIRAAGELRKLIAKREALMMQAMARVAEDWTLVREQYDIMMAEKENPSPRTPGDGLDAFEQFFSVPDAQAPPK